MDASTKHLVASQQTALAGYERNSTLEPNIVSGIEGIALQASKRPLSVNFPLPIDVVEIILSYVPAEDLLENCVHVEQWVDIIYSNGLWRLKCLRKWKNFAKPDPIPLNFYQLLHFMPFGRNLLKNPCGKDGLSSWKVTKNGGDGWRIENPPYSGADPLPDADCQFCFATSFGDCEKFQQIRLSDYKITDEMMDTVRPQILVSECYAAFWRGGSEYKLKVAILDSNSTKLDHFEYEHTDPEWERHWERKLTWRWQKVEHIFKNYPEGVRTISFSHTGRDAFFRCKMAEATVKLIM